MTNIDIKLNKKQLLAFQQLWEASINEVLYWGGARWGKTFLLVLWFLLQAIGKPKSAYMIGRKELKRLRATTLLEFFEVAEKYGLKDTFTYNASENIALFTNWSRIFFVNLERMPSDPNYDRLGSYSLTAIGIDEAQEIESKAISVLRGRLSLLEGNGWKTTPKILYTCNPSKWWIRNDFWVPYRQGTMTPDKVFIPALVWDNPLVSQDYIDNLKKSDKTTVERLLYGNFDYDDSDTRLIDDDTLYSLWWDHGTPGNKYLSCDIARMGGDKTVLLVWSGYRIEHIIAYQYETLDKTIEKIRMEAKKHAIPMSRIVVDADGLGAGVADLLKWSKHFHAWESTDGYANLKARCCYKLGELCTLGKLSILDFPCKDEIMEEIATLEADKVDSDSKPTIKNKDWQKEKLGRSPDFSDAIMMRMVFEFNKRSFNLFSI